MQRTTRPERWHQLLRKWDGFPDFYLTVTCHIRVKFGLVCRKFNCSQKDNTKSLWSWHRVAFKTCKPARSFFILAFHHCHKDQYPAVYNFPIRELRSWVSAIQSGLTSGVSQPESSGKSETGFRKRPLSIPPFPGLYSFMQ